MASKKAFAFGFVGIIAATALIIGIIDLNLPDTSPPDVNILSPNFTAYEGESVSVNLYAFDNRGIDQVWYNWNGVNVSYTGVTQVSFTSGFHTLYVWTNDTSGNVRAQSVMFTILNNVNFSAVWDTTKTDAMASASNQVKLPLDERGFYQFKVDWNDGTHDIFAYSEDVTPCCDPPTLIHTYASPGEYEINITGTFIGWSIIVSDRVKLIDIKHWGDLRLGNRGEYFYLCTNMNITATDTPNLNGTLTFVNAFSGCTFLNQVPNLALWDFSNVSNMEGMFYGATNFNQDISDWNVSKVQNMGYMFNGASKFNQNISSWDVSNVLTMRIMFGGASAFNQNISAWDVSRVTDMRSMFLDASLFDQDLGSWNVTKVTTMDNMFEGVTLSTANYDSLLIGWSQLDLKSNVPFSGGSSKYSAGAAATARGILTGTFGWIITDGGQV